MMRMKYFVKAKDEDSIADFDSKTRRKYTKPHEDCSDSGLNMKNIYESIVGNNDTDHTDNPGSSKHIKPVKTVKQVQHTDKFIQKHFNINPLMKAIEINNISDVKSMMLGNEKNINMTDQFGWTPLMCACCAGATDIVHYLLQLQPDVSIQDKKGNTCFNLAVSKGHRGIVTILKNHIHKTNAGSITRLSNNSNNKLKKGNDIEEFFCDVCGQSFKNIGWNEHITSTVHLFSSASKSKIGTLYGIPESNKGFQILLKQGWDKEKGLGPQGSGHKFPPKTILKQDRTGLGAKHYTARVTHPAADVVQNRKTKQGIKHDLKITKNKDKKKEREIRRMLN